MAATLDRYNKKFLVGEQGKELGSVNNKEQGMAEEANKDAKKREHNKNTRRKMRSYIIPHKKH